MSVVRAFLAMEVRLGAVLAQPKVKKLLSSDHFSVDGTLIEAWASMPRTHHLRISSEPVNHGRPSAASAFFNSLLVLLRHKFR
jgi:hypothetical protein